MCIFKKLFKQTPKIVLPKKTLADIKKFDDVWIKIDDQLFEGWVVERVGDALLIVYSNANNQLIEVRILIKRPYDKTFFKNENITLLLDKYENDV